MKKLNKQIFLEELPRKEGIGAFKGMQVIDWKNTIGYHIPFEYNNIKGNIKIVNYDGKHLYVQYECDRLFKIKTSNLARCELGKMLEGISIVKSDFQIEIGQTFEDSNKNITIIDREYRTNKHKKGYIQNRKYYKYKCTKCGYNEGWIEESSLIGKRNIGCSCCNNKTVVQGINDIPTTAPWMIKYFQGGYDEAKMYTKASNKKIKPVCPIAEGLRIKRCV